jgi:hypothetical protein
MLLVLVASLGEGEVRGAAAGVKAAPARRAAEEAVARAAKAARAEAEALLGSSGWGAAVAAAEVAAAAEPQPASPPKPPPHLEASPRPPTLSPPPAPPVSLTGCGGFSLFEGAPRARAERAGRFAAAAARVAALASAPPGAAAAEAATLAWRALAKDWRAAHTLSPALLDALVGWVDCEGGGSVSAVRARRARGEKRGLPPQLTHTHTHTTFLPHPRAQGGDPLRVALAWLSLGAERCARGAAAAAAGGGPPPPLPPLPGGGQCPLAALAANADLLLRTSALCLWSSRRTTSGAAWDFCGAFAALHAALGSGVSREEVRLRFRVFARRRTLC